MTSKKDPPSLEPEQHSLEFPWKNNVPPSNLYLFPELKNLLPHTPIKILDVGCGNGHLTAKLAGLGHTVLGIDGSQSGIEIAARTYSNAPNLSFKQSSVFEDFKKLCEPVDIVISCEVIEHLQSPSEMLKRCFQILKPGGTLIVTTPYHGYFKNLTISLLNGWDNHFKVDLDYGHIKFFSKRTLSQMMIKTGFTKPSFKYVGRTWGLWKSMIAVSRK